MAFRGQFQGWKLGPGALTWRWTIPNTIIASASRRTENSLDPPSLRRSGGVHPASDRPCWPSRRASAAGRRRTCAGRGNSGRARLARRGPRRKVAGDPSPDARRRKRPRSPSRPPFPSHHGVIPPNWPPIGLGPRKPLPRLVSSRFRPRVHQRPPGPRPGAHLGRRSARGEVSGITGLCSREHFADETDDPCAFWGDVRCLLGRIRAYGRGWSGPSEAESEPGIRVKCPSGSAPRVSDDTTAMIPLQAPLPGLSPGSRFSGRDGLPRPPGRAPRRRSPRRSGGRGRGCRRPTKGPIRRRSPAP